MPPDTFEKILPYAMVSGHRESLGEGLPGDRAESSGVVCRADALCRLQSHLLCRLHAFHGDGRAPGLRCGSPRQPAPARAGVVAEAADSAAAALAEAEAERSKSSCRYRLSVSSSPFRLFLARTDALLHCSDRAIPLRYRTSGRAISAAIWSDFLRSCISITTPCRY